MLMMETLAEDITALESYIVADLDSALYRQPVLGLQ